MNERSIIQVKLDHSPYDVIIGSNLAESILTLKDKLQNQGTSCFAIVDQNIQHTHTEFLSNAFGGIETFILPAAESSKSFQSLEQICEFLKEKKADRNSCIFAIGGGVTGDVSAFVAAIYMRGIDYYHIPTTLLAMVDSAIGGKSGINLKSGKNLVGAVHQPKGVFIDTELLSTLPDQEFASGMAEVIKTGMLKDASLFKQLAKNSPVHATSDHLHEIIKQCCQIKVDVVTADEKENDLSGGRALLNLGHTFGHAIEAVTEYKAYKHGEAVSIGLVLAARYSQELGNLSANDIEKIQKLLEKYNLPLKLKEPLSTGALMNAMHHDKKTVSGKLRLIGLKSIGQACILKDVDENLIKSLWEEVGAN